MAGKGCGQLFCGIVLVLQGILLVQFVIVYQNERNSTQILQETEKLQANRNMETKLKPSNLEMKDYQLLPSKAIIANMSYEEITTFYHRYVYNKQASCSKMIRLGKVEDGGWDICDDEQYRPKYNNCTVFSFGINFDFSFDDAISRRYGCQVHSFDPSMKKADHKRSDKIYFHAIGLSSRDEIHPKGWKMERLQTMRENILKSKTAIDILKMDIEDMELQTIPEILGSGSMKDVKQFTVEIHLKTRPVLKPPPWEKYAQAFNSLKDLYDNGFRMIYTHENPTCIFRYRVERQCTCHDISFVHI